MKKQEISFRMDLIRHAKQVTLAGETHAEKLERVIRAAGRAAGGNWGWAESLCLRMQMATLRGMHFALARGFEESLDLLKTSRGCDTLFEGTEWSEEV